MTVISLSKFVFSEFDDKTGIVTVESLDGHKLSWNIQYQNILDFCVRS